jgi:MFS family permease
MSPEESSEPHRQRSRLLDSFRNRPTLPQEEISDGERARSTRLSISIGTFSMMFGNGTMGAPLVGIFRQLGAGPLWIGLLAAVSSSTMLFQPLSSWLSSRFGSRKGYFFLVAYPSRVAWIGVMAVAFFLPPGIATIVTLFVLVTISRVCISMAVPPWFSWMTDLVPEGHRGDFWGSRQMWGRIASTISAIVMNWYLGDSPSLGRFGVFFGIVAVFGFLDVALHHGVVGVEKKPEANGNALLPMLRRPLADKRFSKFLLFCLVFAFGNSLGGSMFQLMLLEEMHFTYFEIAILLSGVLGGVSIIASKVWGRLVDNIKEGPRLIFYVTSTMVALAAYMYPITPARSHVMVGLTMATFGLAWSGWQIAVMTLIAGLSPEEDRSNYMAMYSVVTGIGHMVGAALSGILVEIFHDISYAWGPLILTPIRTMYIVSATARVLSLLLLPMIQQPGALPLGVYAHRIMSMNPFERGTYLYIREKLRSQNGEKKGRR